MLVSVAGLTPQVVTETIWALARREPAFAPGEVHLVTTSVGRELARLALQEQGRLTALATELAIPVPALSFAVPRRADGSELDDLRRPEDHVVLADLLFALLRELTADPASAVHVSLAGGRKTMSFLAGYALSLVARPQDVLSHVLVDPLFEGHPEFFWPPAHPARLLGQRGGPPLDTSRARVELIEVPFVRLRDELPPDLLATSRPFAQAVAAVQAALGEPRLTLDLPQREARADEVRLPLRPVQLAFLLLLARRRSQDDGAVSWRELTPAEVLEAYADLYGFMGAGHERLRRALADGVDAAWFQERKARHDKLVAATLGRRAAPYQLEPVGRRPRTRWRLRLPPSCIRIHQEVQAA